MPGFAALADRVALQLPWTRHCEACGVAVYWVVRGPLGALSDSGDLLTVFSAARCWLNGTNPYDTTQLLASAQAAGAMVGDAPITEAFFRQTPSVYLPPALMLLSPLAQLSWSEARLLFVCLALVAIVVTAVSVARIAGRITALELLFLLACAPLQTGFVKGQPALLACALLAASLAARRPWAGGVLLGLATCLKPQLGLGFLVLALIRNERPKVVAACLLGLGLTLASLVPLPSAALASLLANLADASSAAGINSGSPMNPLRYQLLNLDTLLPASLYGGGTIALLYGVIALVTLVAFRAVRAGDDRMIVIALTAATTVLLGYHRVYDALLLWIGLPVLRLRWHWLESLALRFAYGCFLASGQTIAWQSPFVRAHAGQALGWVMLHHQTLACLLLWLVLVRRIVFPRDPMRMALH